MVSVAEVLEALEGLDLPQNKKEIIKTAQNRQAKREVIEVLETLPDTEFRSLAGIWDGIGRSS